MGVYDTLYERLIHCKYLTARRIFKWLFRCHDLLCSESRGKIRMDQYYPLTVSLLLYTKKGEINTETLSHPHDWLF